MRFLITTMTDIGRVQAANRAKQRDEYTCQVCGLEGEPGAGHEIQGHHIKPVKNGGSNDLENMVTLCRNCHSRVHRFGPAENGEYPAELAEPGEDFEFEWPWPEWVNHCEYLSSFECDPQGYVELGPDYADKKVRVAVLEVLED